MKSDRKSSGLNTVIESLGIYLPPQELLTKDLVQGCQKKILFPIERMTGIKSRHVAGESEFGIDLAKQAISKCLASSQYDPADVDVLISASIARTDGPTVLTSIEPSTSLTLQNHFGFVNAMVFDIASACTGMFTGIYIVDTLIKLGVIKRGLVVSGEYISHLGTTAQKEINKFLDPRLACLTLGDSGAAVMLEASPTPDVGFDSIELCTFGKYAGYCVAGPTDQQHGGGIMHTDALKLTDVGTRLGATHALETITNAGWSYDAFDHLILHQTSRTGMGGAMRAINRLMKDRVCHKGNTIDNLERRGNTATTSHFVALADNIRNRRIKSGERVIFAISGSGLTIGTALYKMDDLPNRFDLTNESQRVRHNTKKLSCPTPSLGETPRIRIESIGTVSQDSALERHNTQTLLKIASNDCLSDSAYDRNDVGLLIFAGTYRSKFVTEPAIAALHAGDMDMNASSMTANGKLTLAFDVRNGAVGFLNACYVAIQMIRAEKTKTAMIVTAEVENNVDEFPQELLGIQETGSAIIIDKSLSTSIGFGRFLFRSFTQRIDAFKSHLTNPDGKAHLCIARDPELEQYYIAGIIDSVTELLAEENLDISQVTKIFPPQISSKFIAQLERAMNVSPSTFVDAVQGRGDLFTSSFPYALQYARNHDLIREGDIGLIISAGSGIQVGCAIYNF